MHLQIHRCQEIYLIQESVVSQHLSRPEQLGNRSALFLVFSFEMADPRMTYAAVVWIREVMAVAEKRIITTAMLKDRLGDAGLVRRNTICDAYISTIY